MTDFVTYSGVELGTKCLSSPEWLPTACSPGQVMHAIREKHVLASRGRQALSFLESANVVERLAIAHALKEPDFPGHEIAMQSLESLGFEVSPEFAELGAEAQLLMAVLDGLIQDQAVPMLELDLAMRAVGRLWQSAFVAPPGFEQYIGRSSAGLIGSGMNFFEAAPLPGLHGHVLGHYLCRVVDLLQAAVAIKDLPNNRVGPTIAMSQWDNPVASITSGRGSHKPFPIRVHSKLIELGPQCSRLTLWFVDSENDERIGVARLATLRTKTGMFEEAVEIAADYGGAIASVVNGVFFPSDEVFSLGPRVRRLLDSVENQVYALAVLEGFYALPSWRGRSFGIRMLRQLLIEDGTAEIVLGRPGAFRSTDQGLPLPFGVQASYAAARLRLSHHWHQIGADYLFSGIMGMSGQAVIDARLRGMNDRILGAAREPPPVTD